MKLMEKPIIQISTWYNQMVSYHLMIYSSAPQTVSCITAGWIFVWSNLSRRNPISDTECPKKDKTDVNRFPRCYYEISCYMWIELSMIARVLNEEFVYMLWLVVNHVWWTNFLVALVTWWWSLWRSPFFMLK